MKKFSQLVELVKELDSKDIWAYMLEIATVIDGEERLSAEQKQDAYDLASTEFENYDNNTIGANVFAEAAIETVLDEKYQEALTRASYFNIHDLFVDQFEPLVLFH